MVVRLLTFEERRALVRRCAERAVDLRVVTAEDIFDVLHAIDSGSYGVVFECARRLCGTRYAMKIATKTAKADHLGVECAMYGRVGAAIGIPQCVFLGTNRAANRVLVMTLLGKPLDHLSLPFSLKTVCIVAEQLIDRLELIHSRGILHRDIKPGNLLLGADKAKHIIHLIDFGLSIPISHSRATGSLVGTFEFMSDAALRGAPQSRRDDIESAAYTLIDLARPGGLPWPARTAADALRARASARSQLCVGLPSEFSALVNYAHRLSFRERPNYGLIRFMFQNLLRKMHASDDMRTEWISPSESRHLDEPFLNFSRQDHPSVLSAVDNILISHDYPRISPNPFRRFIIRIIRVFRRRSSSTVPKKRTVIPI